jgi:CRP-like cAMP-binding protein
MTESTQSINMTPMGQDTHALVFSETKWMTITQLEIRRIKDLPLFVGISPQVQNQILSEGVVRVYSRGSTVFAQGDLADRFFIVLTGWIMLYKMQPNGQMTTLEIFGPGESFAEGAMYMKAGFPAFAEMISTGRLLEMPSGPFINRLRSDPDLALNMLTAMAVRLKSFTSRLERMSTLTAPQRVATFLLRFADAEDASEGGDVIELPYDKQLIAGRLGMSPETLSRSFRKLRHIGVAVRSDEVRIADVAALQKFAAPAP